MPDNSYINTSSRACSCCILSIMQECHVCFCGSGIGQYLRKRMKKLRPVKFLKECAPRPTTEGGHRGCTNLTVSWLSCYGTVDMRKHRPISSCWYLNTAHNFLSQWFGHQIRREKSSLEELHLDLWIKNKSNRQTTCNFCCQWALHNGNA